jgi:hypothetical protein
LFRATTDHGTGNRTCNTGCAFAEGFGGTQSVFEPSDRNRVTA